MLLKIQMFSFMTLTTIPFLCCSMGFGQSPQDSTTEFKTAARRAIDAIGRVDEYLNDDRMGNNVNEAMRIMDAEKAADEVKYAAISDSEKHEAAVLLQAASEEVKMSRIDLSELETGKTP